MSSPSLLRFYSILSTENFRILQCLSNKISLKLLYKCITNDINTPIPTKRTHAKAHMCTYTFTHVIGFKWIELQLLTKENHLIVKHWNITLLLWSLSKCYSNQNGEPWRNACSLSQTTNYLSGLWSVCSNFLCYLHQTTHYSICVFTVFDKKQHKKNHLRHFFLSLVCSNISMEVLLITILFNSREKTRHVIGLFIH